VCNHPELFERADVHSPFAFCESSRTVSLSKETSLNCPYSTKSVIKFTIPKRLYRNGGILNVAGPESKAGFETKYLDHLFNIWTTDNIHDSLYSQEPDSTFSFLRFADLSASDAVRTARQSIMQRWISHLAVREKLARRRFYLDNFELYPTAPVHTYASFLISETQNPFHVLNYGEPLFDMSNVSEDMIPTFSRFEQMYIPTARSPPANLICSDRQCEVEQRDLMFDKPTRAVLFGKVENIPTASKKDAADLTTALTKSNGKGLWPVPISDNGFSYIKVPGK
jgi:DNA helicase INO80